MQLEDWLDDLCVRFIINLPPDELASIERICFQIEEAQWFYEDFVRPLDPSLPSLALRPFHLRITQRCPLFASWTEEQRFAAFDEFLAYKKRVPVRGAIMMNQQMDEIVLVKGWKKGANWSFPRGKINKDENDLDCAIREVDEETGFDLRAAGLVQAEEDTKYVEMTMREQHMRLYVFRGVPKDTHFEPKTRKEISKIQWYKLTDLPTIKRDKQSYHSETGEHLALNANKFYMVAPFLNKLKKCIAEMKKKDKRYSSHVAAPPLHAEQIATEGETDQLVPQPDRAPSMSTSTRNHPINPAETPQAQASDLKKLLNIKPPPDVFRSSRSNAGDDRSRALLELLQKGLVAETQSTPQPHTAQEPWAPDISITQGIVQQNPHLLYDAQPTPHASAPQFSSPQSQSDRPFPRSISQDQDTGISRNSQSGLPHNDYSAAPYQQTQAYQLFQSPEHNANPAVPPANALPKLTPHTQALLQAFHVDKTTASLSEKQIPLEKQKLLAAFASPADQKNVEQQGLVAPSTASEVTTQQPSDLTDRGVTTPRIQTPGTSTTKGPSDLLKLLRVSAPLNTSQSREQDGSEVVGDVPSDAKVTEQKSGAISSTGLAQVPNPVSSPDALLEPPGQLAASQPEPQPSQHTKPIVDVKTLQAAPVELAATPAGSNTHLKSGEQDLFSLLSRHKAVDNKERDINTSQAGRTFATLGSPLAQPQLDAVARPVKKVTEHRRSPVPASRMLYDHKRDTMSPQTIKKILSRPSDAPRLPRSPQVSKVESHGHSSTRSPKRSEVAKEPPKPFQPTILKRPSTARSEDKEVQPSTQASTVQAASMPATQEQKANLEKSLHHPHAQSSSQKVSQKEMKKDVGKQRIEDGVSSQPQPEHTDDLPLSQKPSQQSRSLAQSSAQSEVSKQTKTQTRAQRDLLTLFGNPRSGSMAVSPLPASQPSSQNLKHASNANPSNDHPGAAAVPRDSPKSSPHDLPLRHSTKMEEHSASESASGIISPLTASQLISPTLGPIASAVSITTPTQVPTHTETGMLIPIGASMSTRSRVSSLASAASGMTSNGARTGFVAGVGGAALSDSIDSLLGGGGAGPTSTSASNPALGAASTRSDTLVNTIPKIGGSAGTSTATDSRDPAIKPIGSSIPTVPRGISTTNAASSGIGQETRRPSTNAPEKRTTAAGDKAFLLHYLGRIASQESN